MSEGLKTQPKKPRGRPKKAEQEIIDVDKTLSPQLNIAAPIVEKKKESTHKQSIVHQFSTPEDETAKIIAAQIAANNLALQQAMSGQPSPVAPAPEKKTEHKKIAKTKTAEPALPITAEAVNSFIQKTPLEVYAETLHRDLTNSSRYIRNGVVESAEVDRHLKGCSQSFRYKIESKENGDSYITITDANGGVTNTKLFKIL